MDLMKFDFWIAEVIPCIIFAAALFFDFLNIGNLKKWCRSYYPLYFLTVVVAFEAVFKIKGSHIIEFLYSFSVIWFLAENWARLGLNLGAFGAFLNCLVRSLNGGYMPVFYEFDESFFDYRALDSDTVLPILSDWISFKGYWMSVGDILLFSGALIFLIHQVCIFFKKRRR